MTTRNAIMARTRVVQVARAALAVRVCGFVLLVRPFVRVAGSASGNQLGVAALRRRSVVAGVGDQLELPPFWLVHALTWPARIDRWSLARAALVWVPTLEGALPRAAQEVRRVAQGYHERHGGRVVFFSDLEALLDEEGARWDERRIDPSAAVDHLLHGDVAVPGLLLLIGWSAHKVLAENPRAPIPDTDDASARPAPAWRREAVRRAIALQLAVDWPAHVRRLTDEGRLASPASVASAGDLESGQRGA